MLRAPRPLGLARAAHLRGDAHAPEEEHGWCESVDTSLVHGRKTRQYQQLFDAMQTHSWLMPSNKRELYWFTGGVLGYVVHKYGRCESELAMG